MRWGLVVGLAYVLVAWFSLPLLWHRHEQRHPELASVPNVTHTRTGIPGNPLNVGLVGTEEQIRLAAGSYPADPITISFSPGIAEGVVLKRPFDEARVSPLYLYGRKEPLAFEKPVGDNPREMHLRIEPGGTLVLVTDSFFEWAKGEGEQDGISRLDAFVAEHAHEPPASFIEALHAHLITHAAGQAQPDDLTVVIVKRSQPDAEWHNHD